MSRSLVSVNANQSANVGKGCISGHGVVGGKSVVFVFLVMARFIDAIVEF